MFFVFICVAFVFARYPPPFLPLPPFHKSSYWTRTKRDKLENSVIVPQFLPEQFFLRRKRSLLGLEVKANSIKPQRNDV